ncbi:MAG TPA: exonuclease domain-containing protein [Acidimicrobiales bacterium]|nr:exonuclease domain-containing protein [Acidimicrobiales bacterium]
MTRAARWDDQELLAFDLETTGVDPSRDVPVSYALVAVEQGVVTSWDAALVDPGREIPAGASAVHGITTECARREGIALGIAVRRIADSLLDASVRGVPVVGMKVDYDLTMLDSCYRRETGRGLAELGFRGPVLDALVIDRHVDRYRRGKRTLADLCAHYGVDISHAHDASADAKAAADVVRALCRCYPDLQSASPWDLHVWQKSWHREWEVSFAEWRALKGLSPIADGVSEWPIAAAHQPLAARVAV